MKYFIVIVFFIYSSISFACGKGNVPIVVKTKPSTLNGNVMEISIEAPERHEKFKFLGAAYHRGDNYIPMNRGLSDLGAVFYTLKGRKEFFAGASIQVSYSFGVDRVLCAYKQKINLENAIKNCSSCNGGS